MKNVLIVLNYNDFKVTMDFVNPVKNYKIIDMIIVVDNCSTDESLKELKKLECDKIKVIQTDKNGGYGYGNNVGIKCAIKLYKNCNIIISNPDVVVKESTIRELINNLNTDEKIAMVGTNINTHGNVHKAWKLTNGFKELLISLPIIGTKYNDKIIGYKKDYYTDKLCETDVISGCFLVARAKAFKDAGFYDEGVFLYYEENIISKKLKDKGYKIMFNNSEEVIHNHSVSVDKVKSQKEKYKILKQSQMYYLNNYTNASTLTKVLIKMIGKIMYLLK